CYVPWSGAIELVIVLEERARRSTRRGGAIRVIRPAVTGTHEKAGLRKPTYRGAQLSAVNRKDLEFVRGNPSHPAGNVARIAIPRPNKRIAISRQPSFTFRELGQRTQSYPSQVLLHLFSFGRAE